jgi:hypothetical protein
LGFSKNLKKPEKSQTFEAISLSFGAILVENERIVYLPEDDHELYISPYEIDKKSSKLKFFNGVKSSRIKMDKKKLKDTLWSGLTIFNDQYYLFDGFQLSIAVLDKKNRFYRSNSVAWDTIMPPKDRLGEPPQFEIKEMRKKFSLEMKTAPGKRIRGIVFKGETESAVQYYVGTSLKSYPLVIMECSKDDHSRCKFTRNCRSSHLKSIPPQNRIGLGYDVQSNVLYMGDRKTNQIKGVNVSSCVESKLTSTLSFDHLKKPIQVISFGNEKLWIGLETRDDYYSTNIFTYSLN